MTLSLILASLDIGIKEWCAIASVAFSAGTTFVVVVQGRAKRDTQNDFTAEKVAEIKVLLGDMRNDFKDLDKKVEDRFGRVWKKLSNQEKDLAVQGSLLEHGLIRLKALEDAQQ